MSQHGTRRKIKGRKLRADFLPNIKSKWVIWYDSFPLFRNTIIAMSLILVHPHMLVSSFVWTFLKWNKMRR